jgi:hypothetical protein
MAEQLRPRELTIEEVQRQERQKRIVRAWSALYNLVAENSQRRGTPADKIHHQKVLPEMADKPKLEVIVNPYWADENGLPRAISVDIFTNGVYTQQYHSVGFWDEGKPRIINVQQSHVSGRFSNDEAIEPDEAARLASYVIQTTDEIFPNPNNPDLTH